MIRSTFLVLLALNAAAAGTSKKAPAAPAPAEAPKAFVVPPKIEFQQMATGVPCQSPDGSVFATGDMSGLYLWRFGDSKPVAQISWPVAGDWGGVSPIAISNDNTRVLMARTKNNDTFELAVGDIQDEKIVVSLVSRPQRCSPPDWPGLKQCEPGGVGHFSADGRRVSYRSVYDGPDHKLIYEDTVYALDGKVLSTEVRRHRWDKDNPIYWLDDQGGRQSLCRDTPAGNLSVRGDSAVCSVRDCATGKRVAFLDGCKGKWDLSVSADGARVISGKTVWNASTGQLIADLKPGPFLDGGWRNPTLDISGNGRYAVESYEYVAEARRQAMRLDLIEVDTGKHLARLESAVDPGNGGILGVAEDGSMAFVSINGIVNLWRFGPGRKLPPVATRAPVAPAAAAPVAETTPDYDAPPRTAMKTDPNAYAVVIGVEKYRQAGIPLVDFAAHDAKTMYDYLTRAMGFDAKNVILLTDGEATKTDFDKNFGRWLKNRVDAKSRVFVYYAGHGAPNPTTGEGYLMPFEADPSYLEDTAYPVARLYAELAKLPTKNVTVVLDACFSGQGGRSLIAQGTRPLVSVKEAKAPEGLVVIAAAAGTQVSASERAGKHGLLTYHLLAGLQGAADADKDGRVTGSELFSYARPAVERAARLQNVEQTPTMSGDASASWITLSKK